MKYALNYHEVVKIVMQRTIKVDGKVRTDKKYPTGLMGEHRFLMICLSGSSLGSPADSSLGYTSKPF